MKTYSDRKNSSIAWIPVIGLFMATFKLAYVSEKTGLKWGAYQMFTVYIFAFFLYSYLG